MNPEQQLDIYMSRYKAQLVKRDVLMERFKNREYVDHEEMNLCEVMIDALEKILLRFCEASVTLPMEEILP